MASVRSLIFAAIEQRLRAIPGVAEVERMPSGDPLAFPALHVFDDGQQPGDDVAGATGRDMAPEIVGFVEGHEGAHAHDALNDLHAAVVAALLTEPPLGGLVETIDEGGMRVVVAGLASERRLSFSLDLPLTFFTTRGDPAQPA